MFSICVSGRINGTASIGCTVSRTRVAFTADVYGWNSCSMSRSISIIVERNIPYDECDSNEISSRLVHERMPNFAGT